MMVFVLLVEEKGVQIREWRVLSHWTQNPRSMWTMWSWTYQLLLWSFLVNLLWPYLPSTSCLWTEVNIICLSAVFIQVYWTSLSNKMLYVDHSARIQYNFDRVLSISGSNLTLCLNFRIQPILQTDIIGKCISLLLTAPTLGQSLAKCSLFGDRSLNWCSNVRNDLDLCNKKGK